MAPREVAVALERSAPLRLPPHPDGRTHNWRRWALEQKRPLAVDLFAGCGGLSLGLEEAGYAVAMSVDHDEWAVESHRHNLPGVALNRDLSDPTNIATVAELLNGLPIKLVAAGPPCQPFSRAGRSKLRSLVEDGIRAERDDRAELWQAFLEVVEQVRPDAVLMENVPDLGLADEFALLRLIAARLERVGYEVDFRLLEAWRFGVPQYRQRLILVGRRDGRPFEWPEGGEEVNLRQAIGDLPPLRGTTGAAEMPAKPPRTKFQRRARKHMNGHRVVWDHVTRPVREDDREAFRLMKPGTRYRDLPERLRRYRSDIFNDKYNRLDWRKPSRSITAHIAKDGYWYIHPQETRTLTVREAARIQTFPDHFRFAGTRSHAFRQVGNAVPPALAAAVGRSLLRGAKRRPRPASRREPARLAKMREKLLAWADKDSRNARWRHPGDPWQVLAGVILQDRTGARDEAARDFLQEFPKLGTGVASAIRTVARVAGGSRRKRLERLAAAARALMTSRRNWTSQKWMRAAGLGPQEEALFRLIGLQEDRILATTAALRVLARLTGRSLDEERRLSEGRMELARFVGIEATEPRVNAALHALGRVVCTAGEPACRKCPLRRHCRSAVS